MRVFTDRYGAGVELAQCLEPVLEPDVDGGGVVVLGMPRGGMPVAFEIAERLEAPLDVLPMRHLDVPTRPGLYYGTIGEGGVRLVDDAVVRECHLGDHEMAQIEAKQLAALRRRARRMRGGHARVPLAGRVAVIVDDGTSLDATAQAACRIARAQGARRVIVAAPTGPVDVEKMLTGYADQVVCLDIRGESYPVRSEYRHFSAVSDGEMVALLDRATRRSANGVGAAVAPTPRYEEVEVVVVGDTTVTGLLTTPEHPIGVVVFVHGSGSSRNSPRNRLVARILNQAGLATLLFDLLTPEEAHNRANVYDVDLLAGRLVDVTGWLRNQSTTSSLPVGYFGVSTGAAAALVAAADSRVAVRAIVSRGGRPDLADRVLARLTVPTLLIVGGRDHVVLKLNRQAQAAMPGTCQLAVVPGATHLFEEAGTLEEVADLARDWFVEHLGRQRGVCQPAEVTAQSGRSSS